MDIKDYVTLLLALGGFLVSILTLYWNRNIAKKQLDLETKKTELESDREAAKNKLDENKFVVDSAIQMLSQVEVLTKRIDELESYNISLREKVIALENENCTLKEKLAGFEKTMFTNSPIYKLFFELSGFAQIVVDIKNGKIIEANKSFCNLYGYSREEISSKSIYDITMQEQETRSALANRIYYVAERIHKNKRGQSLLVEAYASYYEEHDDNYAFITYLPKTECDTIIRIHDLLNEIVNMYNSDYATLWSFHNHGVNKLSGLYQSVKSGNTHLIQDYRNMPMSVFDDVLKDLEKNKILIIGNNDKYESSKRILSHAGLYLMVAIGVYEDDRLIGILTTSWKDKDIAVRFANNEENASKLLKFSQSDLTHKLIKEKLMGEKL